MTTFCKHTRLASLGVVGLFFFSLLFLGIACKDSGTTNETKTSPNNNSGTSYPLPPAPLEAFSPDSAYRWVEKQVAFGPRVPGTKTHKACGDWIVSFLKEKGGTVVEQNASALDYKGQNVPIRNIIASFGPAGGRRIMLSAHWDTRPVADADSIRTTEPILGANDGASGVAVLLELARVFQNHPPATGVDLFFWDTEDGGTSGKDDSWCLGSQHWAKTPHQPGYNARFGINLDMVGCKNATFTQEAYSRQAAPDLLNEVWRKAHQLGYGSYFPFAPVGVIVDDHYFVNKIAGIPYIDIIHIDVAKQGGFFPHWHTHGDNMDVIDRKTLEATGRTVLAFLFEQRPT